MAKCLFYISFFFFAYVALYSVELDFKFTITSVCHQFNGPDVIKGKKKCLTELAFVSLRGYDEMFCSYVVYLADGLTM